MPKKLPSKLAQHRRNWIGLSLLYLGSDDLGLLSGFLNQLVDRFFVVGKLARAAVILSQWLGGLNSKQLWEV